MREEVAQTSVSIKRTAALIFITIVMLLLITTGCYHDNSDAATTEYSITVEVTNGYSDSSNPSKCTAGQDVTIVIHASSGYIVNEYVKVLGTRTSYSIHTEDHYTVTVEIKGVGGNIRIYGTFDPTASVSLNSTPSTSGNPFSNAIPGEDYTCKLPSKYGYDFPDSISITVNGSTLATSRYMYNSNTGQITIYSSYFDSGDRIVIKANYEPKEFNITGHITHGTLDTGSSKPKYGQSYRFQIEPYGGYDVPNTVTITGGTPTTVRPDSNGWYTIEKVNGDITVTGTCGAATYKIIYHDGNNRLTLNPSEYTYGEGALLPSTVDKPLFIFQYWTDEDGNKITRIPSNVYGDYHVYAHFIDDLSVYDNDGTKMIYYIVAVVSIMSIFGVAYISRK